MKLNNIFLSLITLAALAGCSDEEFAGPDNGNGQDKGLPAVLMINGSTSTDVETKTNTNSQEGDLYVFVYDQSGNFLGQGCSKDDNKAVKIKGITGEDVTPNDKDVIVAEKDMLSGTDVDVILIANPPADIVTEYGKGNVSFKTLSEAMASLDDQIEMYENEDCRSTSCQRIKMTLDRGFNYCGETREGVTDQAWCHQKYTKQIPLYRLISQIRLKEIHCYGLGETMDNGEKCPNANNFVLRKVYLQKGFHDRSFLFPEKISIDAVASDDKTTLFNQFCGLIQNTKEQESSANGNNLFKEGLKTGVGIIENRDVAGILVTTASSCKWDKPCSTVFYNLANTWTTNTSMYTMSELLNCAYSFEECNGSPVYLILEGYYATVGSDANTVTNQKQYVYYKIKISDANDKFRRNSIYNVTVKIKGKGESSLPPVDDPAGSENVSANIEIAKMAEANPDFTFGD